MNSIFSYGIFHSWLFYFMLAHFLLLVFLIVVNFKEILKAVAGIDKKVWICLAIIFLIGFIFRNSGYWLGTHTDGYVAQEAAHLWVLHGQFVKACALGDHATCKLFEQVLAPPGYPLLISLVHLIFGFHNLSASVISAILSSLTIILAFLISYLIFKKQEGALFAALVYSLIPLNIINSQSGESRPTGLFFAGLAVLLFLLSIKEKKFLLWLGTAVSVSYAIYVRQESYILIPIMLVFVLIFEWPRIKQLFYDLKTGRPDLFFFGKITAVVFLFLTLQLWMFRWLLFGNPFNSYASGGFFALKIKAFSIVFPALIQQIFNYSPVLGSGWILHYNFVPSIFFIFGLFLILWRPSKKAFFLVFIYLAYLFLYATFFDGAIVGTYGLTGDYVRRSLMLHLPYAVIAGCGLAWVFKRFSIVSSLVLIFLLCLIFNPGSFDINKIKNVYFSSSLFHDSRAQKQGEGYLIWPGDNYWKAAAQIPEGCLVISNVNMFLLNDHFKNSNFRVAQIDLINKMTKDIFAEELKKSDCLVYFKDFRCSFQTTSKDDESCGFLNETLNYELILKQGEVSLYRAKLKSNVNTQNQEADFN